MTASFTTATLKQEVNRYENSDFHDNCAVDFIDNGVIEINEFISKESVLEILDDAAELARINWDGDEVLLDMIVTIRDKVLAL